MKILIPESKVEKTAAVKREKTPQKGKLSYNEKREFGILEIDIEKLQKKNVGLSCCRDFGYNI